MQSMGKNALQEFIVDRPQSKRQSEPEKTGSASLVVFDAPLAANKVAKRLSLFSSYARITTSKFSTCNRDRHRQAKHGRIASSC